MRLYTPANMWRTSGDISLEKNAWTALRSRNNRLVVAGPGAGKTELLAQRACYLLETNSCPDPMRILAISFKRDAANNVRDRVRLRCDREFAERFDSFTFDAFAKSVLDRFRDGLPQEIRPPVDYDMDTDVYGFAERVGGVLSNLVPPAHFRNPGLLQTYAPDDFAKWRLCERPLSAYGEPADVVQWGVEQVWTGLLTARPCAINFDMVKRLAARVFELNPLLLRALRLTYSHVFLDEYQDTTYVQYALLQTCFQSASSIITAVGDNKQRIMIWAGAMPDAFSRIEADFLAERISLLCNYRSDSELVRIQQFLIDAIDPGSGEVTAAEGNKAGDGVCEILLFSDEAQEAARLTEMIGDLLSRGVGPREICILARKLPSQYCGTLLASLMAAGISCRIENEYQDLVCEELVKAIMATMRLAVNVRDPGSWSQALELVCLLTATDPEDTVKVILQEKRLVDFISRLRRMLLTEPITDVIKLKSVIGVIVNFYGQKALRAVFTQYRNTRSYHRILHQFSDLLWQSYAQCGLWPDALDDFEGLDAIPVMTVHKSKGLEYHTVFFIGLEDRAWTKFAEQKDEQTCTFFVAFSRARKEVYFTFCGTRPGRYGNLAQSREQVASLYNMLLRAGVSEVGKL